MSGRQTVASPVGDPRAKPSRRHCREEKRQELHLAIPLFAVLQANTLQSTESPPIFTTTHPAQLEFIDIDD